MLDALRSRMNLAFTRRLVRSPEGRAHLLSQLAEAESSGEARIFDQALARVDDPELARMIEKHRADELRHEALFRDRLARTGATAEVPRELRLIDRIDAALGGFLARPIASAHGVMEAYVLLQVVEERAVTQMPLLAQALREVDPGSAATLDAVLADEERHLKYCRAISRRYAAGEEELAAALAGFREVEARAFRENQIANGAWVIDHGLMGRGAGSLPWRLLLAAARSLPDLPLTPFAAGPRVATA